MPLLEGSLKFIGWIIPLVILAVIILPQAIRILREYERGVIFRLGKLLLFRIRAGCESPAAG